MMRRVTLLVVSLALLVFALQPRAWAAFCNTQGFPHCDTFDGAACGPFNPTTQRCVAPAGVCEWGVCTCNGSNYRCVW